MRFMPTLATVAIIAAVPLISHAQMRPADDHGAHHPDTPQAAPAPAAGGMDMKGGMMMGGGDMPRMMAMMHRGMMGGGMMGGMPARHIEGRLAFLKTELKITPAQEPLWSRFADTVRGVAKNAPPMMQDGAKAAAAPDLLDRYEKSLAMRLETVRALKAAFDPLYAALADDQKKAADELLTGPMGIL